MAETDLKFAEGAISVRYELTNQDDFKYYLYDPLTQVNFCIAKSVPAHSALQIMGDLVRRGSKEIQGMRRQKGELYVSP